MVKVKFENVIEDSDYNEKRILVCEKDFPNAIDHWDGEINDYVYNKVLELDAKYDFIDYENCPFIEISYFNEKNKLLYRDDCVDYMYNL